MIAYCGLDCERCEAYTATLRNDDQLRAKVAKEWTELYNAPVKPEDINCTGCLSSGLKTFYCDQMCTIRKCARQKGIDNCAQCESYPCPDLNQVFRFAPKAKDLLESLRVK